MKRIVFLLMVILVGGGFTGCHYKKKHSTADLSTSALNPIGKAEFTPNVDFAQGFRIQTFSDYKLIQLLNPWKNGEVSQQYCVLAPNAKQPADLPENCMVVRQPVKSIAILSSTHVEPLNMVHELDAVTLVGNGAIINNPYLNARIRTGKVADLKNSGMAKPDAESIVENNPELVFVSGFESVSAEEKKMLAAGLKLCFVAEWMEACPLARAEWIKFFAAFVGKDEEADQEFERIVKEYRRASALAKEVAHKPTVMFNMNFKGVWYTPGGDSYVARLAKDAGAHYYWTKDKKTGSLPLSFECILDNQQTAEYWLNPGSSNNLEELAKWDERYTLFKAFQEKRVFNNNKRVGPGGGNDWWESGVMHPDVILKDMIRIFHPQLVPQHELYYFQRLQ
ncbi:MAG: ABC transporter substrate-binding protein [Marinifilaceae bacterium]